MPFAFLFVGSLLLVSGVRNTQQDLFTLLKSDLTGQGNFVYWIVSILIIGAIGYVDKLRPISHALLVLVLVVLFLSNQGFFSKFTGQLAQTKQSTVNGHPVVSGAIGSVVGSAISNFFSTLL